MIDNILKHFGRNNLTHACNTAFKTLRIYIFELLVQKSEYKLLLMNSDTSILLNVIIFTLFYENF